MPATDVGPAERDALVREALARPWYHTIELAPGVRTPGSVDLRRIASRVLPSRLDGLRCLDVGTFDGFWAFAMAARGAEVVATDLARFDETDWPPPNRAELAAEAGDRSPGERFALADAILGAGVRRVSSRVYDLDPERLGGPFDLVLMGDLLLHLRDPVGGLQAVRRVLRPGGHLLSLEQVHVPLTLLAPHRAVAALESRRSKYLWWVANLRALRDWIELAEFERPRLARVYRLDAVKPQDRWHVALRARRP